MSVRKGILFNMVGIFRENRKKIFIVSIYIILLTFYWTFQSDKEIWLNNQLHPSIADSYLFITLLYRRVFLVMPIYLLMLIQLMKSEHQLQIVIRNQSKVGRWILDQGKIWLLSFYVALVQSVTVLATGLICGQVWINWDKAEPITYFNMANGSCLKEGTSLLEVVFFVILTTTLMYVLVGNIYQIFKDLSRNEILSLIVPCAWGVLEYAVVWNIREDKFHLLILNKLTLTYEFWLNRQYNAYVPVVVCLLIFMWLSKKMAERREYY